MEHATMSLRSIEGFMALMDRGVEWELCYFVRLTLPSFT